MSLLAKLRRWRRASTEQQLAPDTPALQLIVGLGNPGPKYTNTRHNAGERWVRMLAAEYAIPLKTESRFQGEIGQGQILDRHIRILIPATYMNLSGQSVSAVIRYSKMSPAKVLIAHDEVAFPTGVAKLKVGGGLNGHRGLESIVQALGGDRDFVRLRIGVGHPGDPNLLSAYLTKQEMPRKDRELSETAATIDDEAFKALLAGEMQRAMGLFHTSNA